MSAFADVTAQLSGVLTSDGADINTAEFLHACRCIIPIIGVPTPVKILPLALPTTGTQFGCEMACPSRHVHAMMPDNSRTPLRAVQSR